MQCLILTVQLYTSQLNYSHVFNFKIIKDIALSSPSIRRGSNVKSDYAFTIIQHYFYNHKKLNHQYMPSGSPLLPILCAPAFTVIPLLPKATFTPSRYSPFADCRLEHPSSHRVLIHSTCPNQYNTLRSIQLANFFFILTLLHISSFLTLSILVTPT